MKSTTIAMDSRFTLKGSQPAYAPDRTFDTEHIRLEINVDIARETITGRCQTRLRAITGDAHEMVFDAVQFNLIRVLWNGKKIPTTYKDGKLTLAIKNPVPEGARVTVDIEYKIRKPKLGFYFIKPDKFYPKRPTQIWTQGEDEYARYWFPCHDAPHERTTTEVIATVPYGFVAVSNGRLVRTTHNPRRRISTYHWSQEIPHATYLVTLTAGRFSLIKDKWRNVPVQYYCERGREAEALRSFSKTPKMMEFFSSSIGVAYPYAKYAQIAAADFIYGGMENTSATTQTDTTLLTERAALDNSSDELVAHELAHQWFGDYLTCKDWSHAWLNESFATYFDALFKRYDRGNDEFLYALKANAEAYFQEDKDHYRRPIVTKVYKRPSDLFDRHLYEKGSLVLHMLHHHLGEKLFWKAIGTYVRDNRGRVVETVDLLNAIEKATGRNMRAFFDQWVYGAGHPEFRIRQWWDERKKEAVVRVTQSHSTNSEIGLFTMNVEFLFVGRRGQKLEVARVDKKSQLFRFKLSEKPELVIFDPEHKILKRVDFPKNEDAWVLQLKKSTNPLGRIEAAQHLSRMGGKVAHQALRDALLKDNFWGVRAEVARAIGNLRTHEASQLLLHGLDVIDHPKIRRAIYAALESFGDVSIASDIEKRIRTEKSVVAESIALRAIGGLQHPRAGEIMKAALKKDSWNDVIRIGALEGLTATRAEEWIPLLLSYTKPGHHQRLRMAAVRCLAQYGFGHDKIQQRFVELLNDNFLLVQIAAMRGLNQIGDERAVPAIKKIISLDVDGRLKRLAEETVDKITKGFE